MADADRTGCDEALTYVFALLGKRWSGNILGVLLEGQARFGELGRAVPGISPKVLAERLVELAAAGLVERDVDPGPPVAVSYRLTERGQALGPALQLLREWAEGATGASCPSRMSTNDTVSAR